MDRLNLRRVVVKSTVNGKEFQALTTRLAKKVTTKAIVFCAIYKRDHVDHHFTCSK